MANRAVEYVYKIIDQYSDTMKKMSGYTKQFKKDMETAGLKAQKMAKGIGDSMKRFAIVGVAALVAGMTIAVKKGIDLASSLTEVQNVVDVTFGTNSQKINDWSKTTLDAYGLSILESKKYSGVLGAMIKSMGVNESQMIEMSTTLTGLTGDYASFYNLDHETAFQKIRAGISGETEPLKQIGINMSIANLQAFALTKGITKKFSAMTQGEQVMLRYNYLLSVSKDAQGDFSRTLATSWENQKRILTTKFSEKLAIAMSRLLPMLIDAGKWLNAMLDKVDADKLAKNIEITAKSIIKFAKGLFALIKILKPLIITVAFLATGIYIARKAYMAWLIIQWALNAALTANPIGLIIVGIGALIAAIALLIVYKKQVIAFTKKWWDRLKAVLMLLGPMYYYLVIVVEVIRSVIESWDVIVKKFKDGDILGAILEIGKAIVRGILSPFEALLHLMEKLPGMKKITDKVFTGIDKVRESLGLNIGEEKGIKTEPFKRGKSEVNVKTDLSVYTENNMTVMPFKKRGNLGYQMKDAYAQ